MRVTLPGEIVVRAGGELGRAEIEATDWSLTPGRYVGVAPPEEDEDFDFEQALHDIHIELVDLNKEVAELAAKNSGELRGVGGMIAPAWVWCDLVTTAPRSAVDQRREVRAESSGRVGRPHSRRGSDPRCGLGSETADRETSTRRLAIRT